MSEKQNKEFFETETEEALGILTNEYANGKKTKSVALSDGRKAVIRTLNGNDMIEVNKRASGRQEFYINAMLSVSTKIDEKHQTLEDIGEILAKDYNKINICNSALNF